MAVAVAVAMLCDKCCDNHAKADLLRDRQPLVFLHPCFSIQRLRAHTSSSIFILHIRAARLHAYDAASLSIHSLHLACCLVKQAYSIPAPRKV